MFGLIKEMFAVLLNVCILVSFGRSLPPKEPTKCLTLNNWPWKARPTLVNINSDETLFFSHLLLVLISVVQAVTLLMFHMLTFVFYLVKVKNEVK